MGTFNIDPPKSTKLGEENTVVRYADTPAVVQKSIQRMEGTPIVGTYYQQLLESKDSPRILDTSLTPTMQQYRRIYNTPILLSSELDFDQDTGIGTLKITGSGLLYPSIVPNWGDMFLAKIADGRTVLFTVKDFSALTYLTGSAHSVSIESYSVGMSEHIANLNLKVVETYYFDPIKFEIGKDSNKAKEDRDTSLARLVDLYYDYFYDKYTQTFLYPDDSKRVYDPNMVEFVDDLIPRAYRNIHPKVRVYSTDNGEYKDKYRTILDMLMTKTCHPKDILSGQVIRVSPSCFDSRRVYHNIATSTIDEVIWPRSIKTLTTSAIPDSSDGTYYIASKAYYHRDHINYSELDIHITNYLTGKENYTSELVNTINNFITESKEKLFYLIPVYFLLLKESIVA